MSQLARDLFKSCIDEEVREELGVQPLLDLLHSLGGWPVLEGSNWGKEDSFKWWEWTYKTNQHGLGIRDDIHRMFLDSCSHMLPHVDWDKP